MPDSVKAQSLGMGSSISGREGDDEGHLPLALEQAAKQANLAFWRWSLAEQKVTHWSGAYEEITADFVASGSGYDHLLRPIHEDDREAVRQAYLDSDEGPRDFSIDFRLCLPDGSIRWVHEHGDVEYDENGEAIGYVGVIQDITERKELEEKLRAAQASLEEKLTEQSRALKISEENLLQAQQLGHMGSWEWDRVSDDAISYSEECARLLGVPAGEKLNYANFVENNVHPDDRASVRDMVERVRNDPASYEIEYRVVRPDGRVRHILELGGVVENASGGNSFRRGICQDITERKARELNLMQREAMLTQAMRTGNMGAWIWDDDKGECIYCMEELADIFGETVEEFLAGRGTSEGVYADVHPDDVARYKEITERELKPGEKYTVDFRERSRTGEMRHLREIGEEFQAEWSNNRLSIGLVQDITEQVKTRDALREKEAALADARVLAITDPLTGLYNRRHFDAIFHQELARAKRNKQELALIIFDIDHFKQLNDRYGHGQGDDALKSIAERLQNICRRPGDFPFRLGGEEFGVLAVDQSGHMGELFAEIIRGSVEDLKIENADSAVSDYMTASFGVASGVPGADDTVESFLAVADARLYQAKAEGRNRVVSED